ncbi:TAF6L factor, partial [Irena cyanogastra]|nr:TAF6L factor [Irena cyanogastra]
QAVCGCGSQDSLPLRPLREGDLFFPEDREVNLVELALATNIPKGCAETAVRVHVSYLDGKGNLEPQGAASPGSLSQLSPPAPGEKCPQCPQCPPGDPLLSPLSPQVKSVSHDLEQLSRLLQLARSLLQNPFLCLGSYACSLMGSVLYCVLEPLAASINPLNDHWTLRDYAALLLGRIFW